MTTFQKPPARHASRYRPGAGATKADHTRQPVAHAGKQRIAFWRIGAEAARQASDIVPRWLPEGRKEGREWVCRNPVRNDHRPGSFKVNLATGKWADFAAGEAGGDLISLAAYLYHLQPVEAALRVSAMLGMDPYEP